VKLEESSESSTGQLARQEELQTFAKRVKSSLGSSSKSNTDSFHSILQNEEGKILSVFETGIELFVSEHYQPRPAFDGGSNHDASIREYDPPRRTLRPGLRTVPRQTSSI
jgi:hypothetical protein